MPRRQRLISVPFRPATVSPMVAQTRKAEFGIRKLARRSPITGPALPHAAQAFKLRRRAKRRARRAAKIKKLIIAGEANPHAAQASPLRGRAIHSARRSGKNVHAAHGRSQAQQKKEQTSRPAPLLDSEIKTCNQKFTTLALQSPAAPAPGHNQAKATHPRQKPCQTAAYPRACHFLRQGPRAWKARADPPD